MPITFVDQTIQEGVGVSICYAGHFCIQNLPDKTVFFNFLSVMLFISKPIQEGFEFLLVMLITSTFETLRQSSSACCILLIKSNCSQVPSCQIFSLSNVNLINISLVAVSLIIINRTAYSNL